MFGPGIVNQSQGSVFDAGAPAMPFVASDDPSFSGGLPGRIAVVTGIDPQNSTQPTPPLDDNSADSTATTWSSRGSFGGNARHESAQLTSPVRGLGYCVGPLSKKILPRRANHRHILIIARTSTSPRREIGGGLFELDSVSRYFSNRTAAAMRDATSSHARCKRRCKRAAVRTPVEHDLRADASFVPRGNCPTLCAGAAFGPGSYISAGTRERAGTRCGFSATSARGPSAIIRLCGSHRRDRGSRPEMIATAIMPHISFIQEVGMTAYLISLSLMGLIAIAVWEGFS
jgi:hypothetical protein